MVTKKPPAYGVQALVQKRALERAAQEDCSVDSSAIAAAHYNREASELVLTFTGGRSYAYQGVSPQRYKAFCDSPSKGRYFNSVMRDAYPFRRL
jgi:hypothetical protein